MYPVQTTGGSIPGCAPNRRVSPWGRTGSPAAIAYPDRVAAARGYSYSSHYQLYQTYAPDFVPLDLNRVGIWGYTVQEAVAAHRKGRNDEGSWRPQLTAIEGATGLVVGALGINDLQFSNVLFWAKNYYNAGSAQVALAAHQLIQARAGDFDVLFASLSQAKRNGAQVIVTLYYNPYDSSNRFCGDLENIGNAVVDSLNLELANRARSNGFTVADFRPAFRDRGSGTAQSYVFGTQCKTSTAIADWLPSWLGGGGGQEALAAGFDPHPNNAGTQATAQVVTERISSW